MSAINPNNINGNYPVAGQDNDSQGFRDNFTNIRNNLSLTKTELEDLQNKVILKTALSGTTLTNDMSGSQLVAPQLRSWTQAQVDQGTVGGSVTLDFTFGNFQKITPSSPVTLEFENWPGLVGSGAIGYGNMRIWLEIQDTDYTVTLPSDVSVAVDDIAGYDPDTRIIKFDSAGNYVFDISSADGGDTYMIFDVTRNRATFRDPSFYFNNTQNPTLQVGHNVFTYSPTDDGLYGDTLSVYGSGDSYAPHSRHLNRISDANQHVQSGGWSVSSSRANVINQYTENPIFSGDFIGYFSGFAFTSNAATYSNPNYFETAGIKMFATGSNVSIGGNLAVFTKADGGQTVQAIGVEDDQSVRFFGDVTFDGAVNFDANLSGVSLGIDELNDVTITSPSQGEFFRYDSTTSEWINVPYIGDFIEHDVTIADNGSGSQEVFFLDGQPLKSNSGAEFGLKFITGNRYRFNIDDVSNADAPLRFSTTPDTSVPSSVTDYTTNVTRVGTAGNAGAYVEITITSETPDTLYLYGQEIDPGIDTSLIGAALPIQVGVESYRGGEDLANGAAASLASSVSYFTTTAPETATLAAGRDGQIKTFAMKGDGGDMVITVSNAGWKSSGTGTVTFTNIGDSCTLQYFANKWFCIGNNGATFA